MADRLLEVADIAAAAIGAAWSPVAPDSVAREYGDEEPTASFLGRRVYVFPMGDGEVDRISRSEVEWSYRLAIVVAEKYDGVGLPTKAWMDTRVEFTRTKVYDVLNVDRQSEFLGTPATLWTQSIDRPEAYDFESYRKLGFFWSSVEVELRELVAG